MPEDPAHVEERGAFAVARCLTCGWQGPARRSRERARTDLAHHLASAPAHTPTGRPTHTLASDATVAVVEPADG